MKQLFIKIKSKYYFIPSLYLIFFIILVFVLNTLEKYQLVPSWFSSSVTYGNEILPLMVGSIVTLTTITFSLMMVVLTMYGAQFSPRTLQDFLSNKPTQHILGYLIGSSIFGVIGYYLIQNIQSDVIIPVFGTIFFILAIALFALFIYYVSKRVQITSYIRELVKTISQTVEKQHNAVLENPGILYQKEVELQPLLDKEPIVYLAKETGYIINYDVKGLIALAESFDCIIITKKQVGQYVIKDDSIMEIHKLKKPIEDIKEQIDELVQVGDEAQIEGNFDVGSKKLVDIALRALSPGINDPETTRFCLSHLGYILDKISSILAHTIYKSDDKVRLVNRQIYFTKVLYEHFSEIKLYGFNNYSVITETLKALLRITNNTDTQQNKEIWTFAHYLLDDKDFSSVHIFDKTPIINVLHTLAERLGVEQDIDVGM